MMGDVLPSSPMELRLALGFFLLADGQLDALVVLMDRPKRAGYTQLTFCVSHSVPLQVRMLLVN